MEMNTRLQVEHPVTEEITGIDLVEKHIRLAAGAQLSWDQSDVQCPRHSIEARVYAENPSQDFMPSTGTVLHLTEPTGAVVRVDSGLRHGAVIGTVFDARLGKVIATGSDRAQALARLDQALDETVILGIKTNLEYLQHLIRDPDVVAGTIDTTLVEARLPNMTFDRPQPRHAHMADHFTHRRQQAATTP